MMVMTNYIKGMHQSHRLCVVKSSSSSIMWITHPPLLKQSIMVIMVTITLLSDDDASCQINTWDLPPVVVEDTMWSGVVGGGVECISSLIRMWDPISGGGDAKCLNAEER